ncbi:MAG: hypothetical protein WAU07_00095 [Microgenomates group bacterium]
MQNTRQQIGIVQLSPNDWEQYTQLRLRALREAPVAFSTTYEKCGFRIADEIEEKLGDGENYPVYVMFREP